MKRILRIATALEFNHNKKKLGEAMSANHDRAQEMARATFKYPKTSQAIEELLFENNEPLPTRVLAIFLAGVIHGQACIGGSKIMIGKFELDDLPEEVLKHMQDLGIIKRKDKNK